MRATGIALERAPDRRRLSWQLRLKGALDRALAVTALLVGWPLLVAIAGLVRLSSPGPALYRQTRLGLHGRSIEVLKFRTLWQDRCDRTDALDIREVVPGDARVTPLGWWLRHTCLDELPQLINVAQGGMSLVGPRPHPLGLDLEFAARSETYARRFRMKPGLTGLAQVSGCRGPVLTGDALEKRLTHDLDYVDNWSLWLDLKILLRTLAQPLMALGRAVGRRLPARSEQTSSRLRVLGVPVSVLDLPTAVETILGWVRAKDAGSPARYVCVTNAHGVIECRRSAELQRVHERAALVTPDGMPLVWIGRARGHASMDRVYGPDLLLALAQAGLPDGLRHYFHGAAPGVPERLAQRLSERFPGLRTVGTESPPFRPLSADERRETAARIQASGADIVWVGLGTPKQERWMAAMAPLLPGVVLIGVGAAFDMHSGTKPQAPLWMQRHGLEWLFRLATEPGRLGRRYATVVPLFLILLAGDLLRTVFSRPGPTQ